MVSAVLTPLGIKCPEGGVRNQEVNQSQNTEEGKIVGFSEFGESTSSYKGYESSDEGDILSSSSEEFSEVGDEDKSSPKMKLSIGEEPAQGEEVTSMEV